jgi:hypothetical protein
MDMLLDLYELEQQEKNIRTIEQSGGIRKQNRYTSANRGKSEHNEASTDT